MKASLVFYFTVMVICEDLMDSTTANRYRFCHPLSEDWLDVTELIVIREDVSSGD
jgi:hypothetical protein